MSRFVELKIEEGYLKFRAFAGLVEAAQYLYEIRTPPSLPNFRALGEIQGKGRYVEKKSIPL